MRLLLRGCAAALAALVLAATPAAAPTASAERLLRPDRPDVCAYTAHDLGRLAAFETAIGRSVDCALVYSRSNPTWADWSDPWFTRHPTHRWADWVAAAPRGRHLVIGQSLVPDAVPADWRHRGARGEYDAHARALARNLVRHGLGRSVILLAHEANGDWNRDSIGTTAAQRRAWVAYWARTARVMRSVPGAAFRFDWTVNAGYRDIPFLSYYPGDDVVDVIGIDQYDAPSLGSVPASGAARWRALADQRGGMRALAAFARSRGKPLSVPETALVTRRAGGGGDDPAFVEGLASVTREQPTAYVSYFDRNAPGVLRLSQVPRSLAAWRRAFPAG